MSQGPASIIPMREVEFFKWLVRDERTGKLRPTRWRMTVEEAAERYPGAQRVEESREVRYCPETPDDVRATCTSAFLGRQTH